MDKSDKDLLLALWQKGDDLSFAWLDNAENSEADKYRNVKSVGASQNLQLLIAQKLFDALADEKLIAIGFQTEPHKSDGPVNIPRHSFMRRPTLQEIDGNMIIASGWHFERVRVVKNNSDLLREVLHNPSPLGALPKGECGRPDTYEYSAQVLRSLFHDKVNRKLSAEKLHPAFVTEFEHRFPLSKYKIATPAVRTLRNQLRRFRQELVETGNNDYSN